MKIGDVVESLAGLPVGTWARGARGRLWCVLTREIHKERAGPSGADYSAVMALNPDMTHTDVGHQVIAAVAAHTRPKGAVTCGSVRGVGSHSIGTHRGPQRRRGRGW